MFQVSRMLRGSAWEKQMVMFRPLWVKAVPVSMTVERGGYRRLERAVDALPPHTPPSVVPLFWEGKAGEGWTQARDLALGEQVGAAVPVPMGVNRGGLSLQLVSV